jgi:phage terminase large subunit
MDTTLKVELTPKQGLAHKAWTDNITSYLLFGGGAGGGKSFWIASEQIIQCYQYPGIKSFIGRKELKRLMSSTYLSFVKACQFYGVPREDWHLNGQYNYIEFTNGSRIDLLDINYVPSDPLYERFGSLEYTNGFIEEGGEAEFGAFDVLKSRVGRHKNKEFGILGKIGITANPTKNWLYRIFFLPFKEKKLPKEYAFIQSLYGDNPYTAGEYGKQLAQISDQAQRERLMFGNWEYDADPSALIRYDAIIDLFTNSVEIPIGNDGNATEKYITADIARFGQDRTVYAVWHGWELSKLIIKRHQDIVTTTNDLRTLMRTEEVPYSHCCVDEDGIGGGVVDGLTGIRGYVANHAPFEENGQPTNFKNLKAQCSYKLADRINSHQMSVKAEMTEKDKQELIEELGWIKSKDADKDGKRAILPKDEVKEHLGRSPDLGDVIVMRMLFEVEKRLDKVIVSVPTTFHYRNVGYSPKDFGIQKP